MCLRLPVSINVTPNIMKAHDYLEKVLDTWLISIKKQFEQKTDFNTTVFNLSEKSIIKNNNYELITIDNGLSDKRLSNDRLSDDRLSNDRLSNNRLSNDRLSDNESVSPDISETSLFDYDVVEDIM